MERLDKFLCDCGAGTRSQVKLMLKAGAVQVDGKTEKDSSRKIDPQTQQVTLNGTVVGKVGTVVVMLHKPSGYVTATEDKVEKTVMELLCEPYSKMDLKPVGRLDKETEGLLLFTNDGELLHKLISPKHRIPKVYYARHEGQATQEDVQAFAQGLTLKDGTVCLSAELQSLGAGESLITVVEGKYHQVRRMMASRGMHVTYLKRVQEGSVALGDLPLGQLRPLSAEEMSELFKP